MFDVYWALVGFFLIFGVVLFTIFRKRRKYQPIKSRSMAVSFYYLLCLEISLVIFCFHNSDVFDVKCISFWYVLIVGQNTLIALSSARAIRLYYLFLLNKFEFYFFLYKKKPTTKIEKNKEKYRSQPHC
ncbi:hypothetical protein M0813_24587 [Anaeramoeba flamelloides]|uniref:Uncharacterized protein n=1 Tax=Anaeramoeba flamelloides TaxID=1746091 RepID=A0ABQ8Y5X6_9EUKA|nr:hypothetical protein M0813_24587 [Anaeramoeba flamelloides]